MKNSQELVFGINMIFDEIEKVHFIIIAEDISERNVNALQQKQKKKIFLMCIMERKMNLEIFSIKRK